MTGKIIDKFYEELDSYIDFELLDCLNNSSDGWEKEYHVYLAELKKEHLQTEPEQSTIILRELSETQFKIYDRLASKGRWNPYMEVIFGVLSKGETEKCYLAASEFVPRPTSLDYRSLPEELAIETRFLTLEQYVESFGCLSEREALVFLYQLCEGITLLRQADVVHGDITPRNILLTDRMIGDNDFNRFSGVHQRISVKLIDFDVAKSAQISNHTITSTFGTLPYASPEVIDFKNPTDRADIYSLGCILCYMLTGFSPKDTGWQELSKDWSKEVYSIFENCTASYELRYFSPSKLRKDIRKLLIYPDNRFGNKIRKIPGFRSGNPVKMVLFIHGFGIYNLMLLILSIFLEGKVDVFDLVVFGAIHYVLFIIIWFDLYFELGECTGWCEIKRVAPMTAMFIKYFLAITLSVLYFVVTLQLY